MLQSLVLHASQYSVYILGLNLLILLFCFKRIPAQVSAIVFYLLVGFATELYSYYLAKHNINNLFLLHIYTLLEFMTWSYFYYRLFQNKKWFQKVFPWFVAAISVLIIANTIFFEPLHGFNSNAKTTVQFILITYAIYYFFDVFGKIDLTKPLLRSLSFINFAVILYYSSSLFIFMFPKMLIGIGMTRQEINALWAINSLLAFIFQSLILISLWTVAFRKTKS